MTKEEIFDEQIAPLLLQAARIAEANQLTLFALCEFEPGKFSLTKTVEPAPHPYVELVIRAEQAHGNIDNLIFDVMKKPHASLCLALIERTIKEAKA